jgi:hypothetical protein
VKVSLVRLGGADGVDDEDRQSAGEGGFEQERRERSGQVCFQQVCHAAGTAQYDPGPQHHLPEVLSGGESHGVFDVDGAEDGDDEVDRAADDEEYGGGHARLQQHPCDGEGEKGEDAHAQGVPFDVAGGVDGYP